MVIVAGDKVLQTFDRLEMAEFSAKSLVIGHLLGKLVPIGEVQIEELKTRSLS